MERRRSVEFENIYCVFCWGNEIYAFRAKRHSRRARRESVAESGNEDRIGFARTWDISSHLYTVVTQEELKHKFSLAWVADMSAFPSVSVYTDSPSSSPRPIRLCVASGTEKQDCSITYGDTFVPLRPGCPARPRRMWIMMRSLCIARQGTREEYSKAGKNGD